MSYVILIGGGTLQLPMAEAIKQRGYELLVTDADSRCVCAELADMFVPISTYNIPEHLRLAQDLLIGHNQPVAILTDAADVGPTVSAVAIVFGLSACGFHAAETARNKAMFRRTMSNDLEHPVFAIVNKNVYCSEAWLAWQKRVSFTGINPFPIIIKPSDNCASRGISKITKTTTLEQFEQDWQRTVDNNPHGHEIVLEECLTGQEYTTDWFVTKDTVHYVSSAKRFFHNFGIESSHVSPAWPLLTVPDAVRHLVETVARKLDVLGPFKLDFLYDERYGWCVMEAATRWTGGFEGGIGSLQATGRNLKKPLLDFALGLPLDVQDFVPQWYKYSAMYAPLLKVSKLTPELIDYLKHWVGIYDVVQTRIVDKPVTCGADRGVFILTVADKQEDALGAAREAGEWLFNATT